MTPVELPRRPVVDRWAGDIEPHLFVQRYLRGTIVTVEIATGVTAVMPLCRDVVGSRGPSCCRRRVRGPAAIEVVESLKPSAIAAVSLAELCLEANRPANVIGLTNVEYELTLSRTDRPDTLDHEAQDNSPVTVRVAVTS